MKKIISKKIGASLVEYALLVALISIVAIAALTTLGGSISQKFTEVAASVSGAGAGGGVAPGAPGAPAAP